MRSGITVVLVTALGVLAMSSGSASAAERLIAWNADQHLSRLGELQLPENRAPSARTIRKTFGKPSRQTRPFGNSTCEVSWKKLGLKVWLSSFGGARKHICRQRNARLQQVVVNSPEWVTADKGLRVGDSFERLQQLYPETESLTTNKGDAWSVSGSYYSPIGDGGSTADVTARVKGGTVAAFVIWVGGAGE